MVLISQPDVKLKMNNVFFSPSATYHSLQPLGEADAVRQSRRY